MVGGGILQEGTTSDTILIEDGTVTNLEDFKIALESTETDNFLGDGTTTVFTFTNLNGTSDAPLYVTFDDVVFPQFKKDGSTQWTVTATQITFAEAPADRTKIFIRGQEVDFLLLDAHIKVSCASVNLVPLKFGIGLFLFHITSFNIQKPKSWTIFPTLNIL